MTTTTETLLAEYANLTSPAKLEELRAIGQAIIETRREGPFVYDADGKRYLDCNSSAGTFNLGRRHPELVAELRRAAIETDQGNFPMISQEKAQLAKRLAELAPGALECAVFSVVRGESLDFACKLARGFTGRRQLVTFSGGWHGQTGFAMTLSQRDDKSLFGPLIPEVMTIPAGDYATAERTISDRTAALVLEPIQAENHCREFEGELLRQLRELCDQRGVVLVFDESQSGMGRTGERFACQHSGVVPDVLVIGEALAGGLFPIAATLFTQKLNGFMNKHPLIHLSTFGGADLGCRVATKALAIYNRDRPWRNAAEVGGELIARLQRLAARADSPLRSVAGRGLLISLELESPDRANQFCRAAAAAGILAMPAAVASHCVLLRPSLLIDEEQAGAIYDAVEKALS